MSATGTATNGRVHGTVKWFSSAKGYGFIEVKNSKDDIFVHFSGIAADGYKQLEQNQLVTFEITETPKGKQAVDVVVVGERKEKQSTAKHQA